MRYDRNTLYVPFQKTTQFTAKNRVHEDYWLNILQHGLFCFSAYLLNETLAECKVEGEVSALIRRLEAVDQLLLEGFFQNKQIEDPVHQVWFQDTP